MTQVNHLVQSGAEKVVGRHLLLRPDEVLSGILDAAILEVTDDACGVLFERHHVRTGSFT
jgi:hypothetical protein